jgi:hypothetical protein
MDYDSEEGELEMMDLASGESQSESNSQDMEEEYVAEMLGNKKEMKKMRAEMAEIMQNKQGATEEAEGVEEQDDDASVDSDIQLAAQNQQEEDL